MTRYIRDSIIFSLLITGLFLSANENLINRPFKASGRIDAMLDQDLDDLNLVQLNLKNDSLYNIADSFFPDLELLFIASKIIKEFNPSLPVTFGFSFFKTTLEK